MTGIQYCITYPHKLSIIITVITSNVKILSIFLVTMIGGRSRMFYGLNWLSPLRLWGRYSLTRSVEELDQEKDPEQFGAISTAEPTLLRCQSLPSVFFMETLSQTTSSDSRACSLIDQLTCSHYLTPTPHNPPPHQCLTLTDPKGNPITSSFSDGEEDANSTQGALDGSLGNRAGGYTSIKVQHPEGVLCVCVCLVL